MVAWHLVNSSGTCARFLVFTKTVFTSLFLSGVAIIAKAPGRPAGTWESNYRHAKFLRMSVNCLSCQKELKWYTLVFVLFFIVRIMFLLLSSRLRILNNHEKYSLHEINLIVFPTPGVSTQLRDRAHAMTHPYRYTSRKSPFSTNTLTSMQAHGTRTFFSNSLKGQREFTLRFF